MITYKRLNQTMPLKNPIYVSTDIETNGPQMGKNSILSIGSAVFDEDKNCIDTFTVNLETLPEGTENIETMAWWKNYPEAFKASRENCVSPQIGMQQYVSWLKQLPGQPVFVASPAAFDFSFVLYYLHRFTAENPFGWTVIDLRSLVMGLRQTPLSKSTMSYWPKRWFENKPHTHIALEDAIEQGTAFCNMLAEYPQLKHS